MPRAPGPDTLHPTPYHTLHPAPHTLHPASHTLHPTPHTLHHTSYILHPTPYTLYPAPYNLLLLVKFYYSRQILECPELSDTQVYEPMSQEQSDTEINSPQKRLAPGAGSADGRVRDLST